MSTNEEVAELIKVFFRHYTGDIAPARGQMAGQLQQILKETTYAKLLPLVEAVALDGMPLSRATLLMAAKKLQQPAEKPVKVAPLFNPDEFTNPFAIPMPDYVREALNRPRTTPIEKETDLT